MNCYCRYYDLQILYNTRKLQGMRGSLHGDLQLKICSPKVSTVLNDNRELLKNSPGFNPSILRHSGIR